MKTRLGGLNTEVDFLIDIDAIQKKYSAIGGDPRRWMTGVFQVDSDMVGDALQRKVYESCGRFIEAMTKKRWDIVGKCHVYGPYRAHDIDTSITILGKSEYKIRAVFKLADTPKTIREEVPTGLIKRDPEHTIDLAEAKKAIS